MDKSKKPSRKLRRAAVAFHQAGMARIIRTIEQAKAKGKAPQVLGQAFRVPLPSSEDSDLPISRR